jgi:transcriptional regulator with XRE-family HTH domain
VRQQVEESVLERRERAGDRVAEVDGRFALRLAQARLDQDLSRAELARISGVGRHVIEKIENRIQGRRASIGEVIVLAEALGMKPGELLR